MKYEIILNLINRIELYFAFACIWSFGSAMFKDQLVDWRVEFSKWWINEFRNVRFPAAGTVFSYFIESETKKLLPWAERVMDFELDIDIPLQVYKMIYYLLLLYLLFEKTKRVYVFFFSSYHRKH